MQNNSFMNNLRTVWLPKYVFETEGAKITFKLFQMDI